MWDPEEELKDFGEWLLGAPKPKRLSYRELEQIHDYIIKHSVHIEELLRLFYAKHVLQVYSMRSSIFFLRLCTSSIVLAVFV